MKVTGLEACTCVVPLDTGIAFSTRSVGERHFTLVRVLTDTGTEGIGFSYIGHKAGHLATLAVRDLLKDVVVGRDPHQVEAIWDAMYRESLLHGRRGAVLRAISAVDIALWDAISKEANLPLYGYLGECRDEVVPAYASGGYYVEGKGPEELAQEMQSYLEMGFRAVKMKVGRLAPKEDAARIRAAREAVGSDVPLFLDANNAWPDATTAIRAVRIFEEYEPGWIEEPLMPDDIRGHAAIAAAVHTPVATGEIHATRWEFLQLVQQRAASILQPDAGVCGGITEWRRIAAMAASNDIPVAPHWLAEVHIHLVASTPNAIWVEYFTDFNIINLGRLFATGLEVRPGGLALPQGPGLGVELDWSAVKRFSVDGWA
ncbi:MAG: mandelate racemase/muconate lactonizing enzyme family protein [Dehalococcoidia bacterium]